MLVTTQDAKAKLEAEGLSVSCNTPHSLWIAGHVSDVGDGVKLSEDACALLWKSGEWVAVFPAEGLLTYEVPGSLQDLVALIVDVYTQHRSAGGPFQDALKRVVKDSDRFLTGRSIGGLEKRVG